MNNSSSHGGLPWQIRVLGVAYYPTLMLIGCLSNVMVIVVMRRTRSMSKSRDVFTLLAVADTCVLLVNPSRYFVMLATQPARDIRLDGDVPCVVHTFLTYFLKEAATWILVLMTLERFLFAKWPHKSSLYYRRRLKLAVWSSSLLALLAKNLVILFKLSVIRDKDSQKAVSCDSTDQNFRLAFFITTLSLYSLLPFLLLTVFNVTLIRIIARANRRRQQMSMYMGSQHQTQHLHQRQSLCHKSSSASTRPSATATSGTHVNRLLVPVCIIHIMLTMPQCVFEILEATFSWKSKPSLRDQTYTAGLLLVMLASLNNGINGFVYFFSSENFRKNFCQIFQRGVDSGGSGAATFCRSTGRMQHRPSAPLHSQTQQQSHPRPLPPLLRSEFASEVVEALEQ